MSETYSGQEDGEDSVDLDILVETRLIDAYTLLAKARKEFYGEHPDLFEPIPFGKIFEALKVYANRGHVRSANLLAMEGIAVELPDGSMHTYSPAKLPQKVAPTNTLMEKIGAMPNSTISREISEQFIAEYGRTDTSES